MKLHKSTIIITTVITTVFLGVIFNGRIDTSLNQKNNIVHFNWNNGTPYSIWHGDVPYIGGFPIESVNHHLKTQIARYSVYWLSFFICYSVALAFLIEIIGRYTARKYPKVKDISRTLFKIPLKQSIFATAAFIVFWIAANNINTIKAKSKLDNNLGKIVVFEWSGLPEKISGSFHHTNGNAESAANTYIDKHFYYMKIQRFIFGICFSIFCLYFFEAVFRFKEYRNKLNLVI